MDTEVNGQGVLQLAVVSFYLRTLRSWPQVTIFLCKLGKLKEQKEQKMNGIMSTDCWLSCELEELMFPLSRDMDDINRATHATWFQQTFSNITNKVHPMGLYSNMNK